MNANINRRGALRMLAAAAEQRRQEGRRHRHRRRLGGVLDQAIARTSDRTIKP